MRCDVLCVRARSASNQDPIDYVHTQWDPISLYINIYFFPLVLLSAVKDSNYSIIFVLQVSLSGCFVSFNYMYKCTVHLF